MALQAAFPASAGPSEHCFHWLDGDVGPRTEARGLVALVRTDAESVESVRELIDIPAHVEQALRRYAHRAEYHDGSTSSCSRNPNHPEEG